MTKNNIELKIYKPLCLSNVVKRVLNDPEFNKTYNTKILTGVL